MVAPLLLIGGYGVAGAKIARLLRRRNPGLPLVLGGRAPEQGKSLARELGDTTFAHVDLARRDLGLDGHAFSGIAAIVKDDTGNSIQFAGRHAIPYLSMSSGLFEIGLDLIYGIAAGRRAPIVIASHWFCGAGTIAALALAEDFQEVDEVELAIVIDRGGSPSGPATTSDFLRISQACPSMITRTNMSYHWLQGDAARRSITRVDGVAMSAGSAVSCDVISLGRRTAATSVRVMEAFGQSASSAAGGPPADEIGITITGKVEGRRKQLSQVLVGLRDMPMTAIAATIALEQLLGRYGREASSPGVYMIEDLLAPQEFLNKMIEEGVQLITRTE